MFIGYKIVTTQQHVHSAWKPLIKGKLSGSPVTVGKFAAHFFFIRFKCRRSLLISAADREHLFKRMFLS